MKALFFKRKDILALQAIYLAVGFVLLVVLGSSLSYLKRAPFSYWGDFWEFILILSISSPAILLILISWGLFANSKKNLFLAFVSSVVSAMWYFVLSLILLYIRFVYVGKCGFEGYVANGGEISDQCSRKLVSLNMITIFFIIAFVLFVLLWYTILQIIKLREEIRLLSRKLSGRIPTA